MRILVIAAHMDDEVLGAGGTIARHVALGDEVHVCCVAHRIYDHVFDASRNAHEVACARRAQQVLGYANCENLNLPDERLDACLQDVIVPLERVVNAIDPEIAYVNHRGDVNQDHRAVFHASMVALRTSHRPHLRAVLSYEVPSSTEQAPAMPDLAFLPTYYVDIEAHLDAKIAALRCYDTEQRTFPHPRSIEAVKTLAHRRGVESGMRAAEAFILLKGRWLPSHGPIGS